jgi:hypothetical protein
MPLDPNEKLDTQEVLRFATETEKDFEGAMDEWSKADEFYLQEYDLWPNLKGPAKAARPSYHSARAAAVIDQATDAVSTFAPLVTRPPTGGSQADKESADRVEKSVTEFLHDAVTTAAEHASKKAAKNGVLYNYMALYTGLDTNGLGQRPVKSAGEEQADFEQRESEWDQQRHGWNPMVIHATRPGEVLMDPMEKHPDAAVRRYKLKAYQAAALSLKMAERQARRKKEHTAQEQSYRIGAGVDPYEEIKVLEVFTTGYQGVLRDNGDWLYEQETNVWGLQPWCHAWGGGGLTPVRADGFDTKYLARGFLQAIMDDLRTWDQAYTAVHNLLIRTAFARTGSRKDPSEAAAELAGNLLQGEEADWWTEKLPAFPGQIFQHMDGILDDIRMGSFDPQVAGIRQSGVDTATQQLLLSEASQRRFIVLNTQLGGLFSIVAANMLRLGINVMEAFGVNELFVGANPLQRRDIGKNFRIMVTFENIDPVVHVQEKADARQELGLGLTSREDYWKVSRVADASGRKQRILRDQVEDLPEVKTEMLALIARQEGLESVAKKLEEKAAQLRAQAFEEEVALTDMQGNPTVTRQPRDTPPLGSNIGSNAIPRAMAERNGNGR